ncbi:MAG: archaemetzincin family Zn-dependent metalloprotease [Actinobacteria bacterium]|nr:archaemetzincin family Zn-dependent metalloprotease [Actinomycetota bacterium]
MQQKLEIVLFDDLEITDRRIGGLLSGLAGAAGAVFGFESEVGERLGVPAGAFDRKRSQFRGEAFLDSLSSRRQGPELLVGITGLDIFLPGLNYVFGVADRDRGVAIVSLHRLGPEFYGLPPDDELLRERILKEITHEAGHVLGLSHCGRADCIMRFSNAIGDTDRKGPGFCDECRVRLA